MLEIPRVNSATEVLSSVFLLCARFFHIRDCYLCTVTSFLALVIRQNFKMSGNSDDFPALGSSLPWGKSQSRGKFAKLLKEDLARSARSVFSTVGCRSHGLTAGLPFDQRWHEYDKNSYKILSNNAGSQ